MDMNKNSDKNKKPSKIKVKANLNTLNPQRVPVILNEQKTAEDQTAIFG